jgi:DNA repair ATPase RecN
MDHLPAGFWEALTALLGAAALYLGVLARVAKRRESSDRRHAPVVIDYEVLQEHLRPFIDERAEHKARNVLGPLLARMDRMEADMRSHFDQTRADSRELVTLTASLESVRDMSEKYGETLMELVRMVGELRGARE